MSCDAFLERVDALLDGRLAPAEHDEVAGHLGRCADCRGLVAALTAVREGAEDPDLADSILARTTGGTCASAASRLCAWVDGELDAVDGDLVSGHLRHCEECSGLARSVALLPGELARLAAVDPGAGFVEGVLARTSRRSRREPLTARVVRIFEQLLERPRIALEGAFVATAILIVPLLAPGSPFNHLPARALDLVRESSPGQRLLIGSLRGTMSDLEATFVSARKATEASVVSDATAAASATARKCASTWDTILRGFGTLGASAASGQEGAGSDDSERHPASAQENKR